MRKIKIGEEECKMVEKERKNAIWVKKKNFDSGARSQGYLKIDIRSIVHKDL